MATDFYKNLNILKLSVAGVFEERYFSAVPDDWLIVISDIKNSTAAVNDGRSNDVNLVAAGSLIAALNIAKTHNIDIPFFFGGDGGTILIPELLLQEVLVALKHHNLNTIKNFGLEMHIGFVPIKRVMDAGHFLKIARLQIGKGFSKAVMIGDGIKYAEHLIKHTEKDSDDAFEAEKELDLTGLECKWDKVKPPAEQNEIVCFLIEAVNPLEQVAVYKQVFMQMDAIYGNIEKRNPLSLEGLKLLANYSKIRNEMLVKYGKWRMGYFLVSFFRALIGGMLLKYNLAVQAFEGRKYLSLLIANADTLTIDGRINTVITGSMDKRKAFTNYLSQQEQEGKLIYGHHISRESIMTCYIEHFNSRHIHFVDGSDGGYTEASKELKRKASAEGRSEK
jgi:hypothetical protein